jgi:uncharacterized UPF0160 family protein
LVWKHYGEAVCDSKDIADYIEENITQPIDAGDNGVSLYDLKEYQIKPFELYNFVSLFSPPWGSDESKDDQFHQAVDWARGILKRMIMKGQGAQKQHTLIAQVYESSRDKRVLEFDVSISMMSVIQYPDVEVVVCPDDPQSNNKWTATCVRKDFNTFDSRVSFPAKWAGLSGQDLQEVSEIADAEFCHKARFIFVAQSKESAVLAAKLAE